MMEAERNASNDAQKSFGTEIERLAERIVRASEMRLRELQRGQRIAAADRHDPAAARNRVPGPACRRSRTPRRRCSRLRTRQKQIDAAAAAMAEMEQAGDPAAVSEKLAAAGCGAPLRSGADAVLERLAAKMAKPA